MKKILLSMAIVAAGVAANAQISQGTLFLGGSLGFSSTGGGENKVGAVSVDVLSNISWNVTPRVGYFLTDNIAVGLDLNVGQNTANIATAADGTTQERVQQFNFGVGVFGRYYKEIGSNFYFNAELGVGYASGSYTDIVADPATSPTAFQDFSDVSTSTLGVNIAPGITYFPAENWGIDFTLNRLVSFTSVTAETEAKAAFGGGKAEQSRTNFAIGAGLQPTLGLHYYIGR